MLALQVPQQRQIQTTTVCLQCVVAGGAWEAVAFALQSHCNGKGCKEEAGGLVSRLTPPRTKSFAFWAASKLWKKNIKGFLFQSSGRKKNCVSCILKMAMLHYTLLFYLLFSFFLVPPPFFFSFMERILDFEKIRLIFAKIKKSWQMLLLIT